VSLGSATGKEEKRKIRETKIEDQGTNAQHREEKKETPAFVCG